MAREVVTAGTLLDAARAQTGLSDFGDLWFLEPLNQLLRCATAEAGLVPNDPRLGLLIRYLADRLKLIEHLKRHPEVLDEQIDVAAVIVGHARGGSTLLQRLLGTSPQLTSTYHWEMMTPVPFPDEKPGQPAARQEAGRVAVARIIEAMPSIQSWHPLDAMAFEEEIHLLERAFLSTMLTSHFSIPSYSRWIVEYDQSRSYEELVLWLKVLQAQMPERRGRKWLLKSPHHYLAGSIGTAMKTFPKAKIMMTHRRMEDMIPSVCSISAKGQEAQGNRFDPKDLGPRFIAIYRKGLDIMLAVRAKAPAERFLDLRYKDIIADPLKAFRDSLVAMGLEPGPEDEKAAAAWMAKNGRDSHPRHGYTAEEFGITRADIAAHFADYHEMFL